jgi:putative FmdB family regulatory protein
VPIYEYECTSCGKRFEIKQKFSDPPITTCDQFSCEKAQPVTKLISPPAIMFKGTGWYVTDYSDKFKEGSKANGGGQPEKKSENSSESKSSTDGSTSASSSSTTSSGTSAGGSGTGTPSSTSTSASG